MPRRSFNGFGQGTPSKIVPIGTFTTQFQLRLTEDDAYYVAQRASELGLTKTDYIRSLIAHERDGKIEWLPPSLIVDSNSQQGEQIFDHTDDINEQWDKFSEGTSHIPHHEVLEKLEKVNKLRQEQGLEPINASDLK